MLHAGPDFILARSSGASGLVEIVGNINRVPERLHA
jgi:hypothetical protein